MGDAASAMVFEGWFIRFAFKLLEFVLLLGVGAIIGAMWEK